MADYLNSKDQQLALTLQRIFSHGKAVVDRDEYPNISLCENLWHSPGHAPNFSANYEFSTGTSLYKRKFNPV